MPEFPVLLKKLFPKAEVIGGTFGPNQEYLIQSSSLEESLKIYEHRYLWQSRGIEVTLRHKFQGGWRIFDSSLLLEDSDDDQDCITMKPQRYFLQGYCSEWLSENRSIFGQFAPTEFIYRADQTGIEQGLPCVAIKTWHPARLNRSVDETLGQPLCGLDELISAPRKRAIANVATAKAINSRVHYSYEYEWDERIWKFDCTAQKVSDSEVLVLLYDVGSAQRDYWLSRL